MTYTHKHIATADANSTVTVTTKDCVLAFVTINTTSAHALTLKDGNANTIAVIKASIAEQTLTYKITCIRGLTVTVPTGYTGDATISFV